MGAVILATDEATAGVQAAIEAVQEGRSALDAVELGIRKVELDPSVRSVGYGGVPNALGEVECDASIMCGATLQVGAVGALKDHVHAISVARGIMERLPHVMLVGEGAARFAREIGEGELGMLTPETRERHRRWVVTHVPDKSRLRWPDMPLAGVISSGGGPDADRGTVCFLVRDHDGNWAGGASSSGWAYKYPGRLGDSPIIGAGLYVDNRYGAAACTHIGEMTVRAGTCRAVVAYLKKGATVEEACAEAVDDLRRLRGGFFGPVVIHAVDADGNPCVVAVDMDRTVDYWFWREGFEEAELGKAALAKLYAT